MVCVVGVGLKVTFRPTLDRTSELEAPGRRGELSVTAVAILTLSCAEIRNDTSLATHVHRCCTSVTSNRRICDGAQLKVRERIGDIGMTSKVWSSECLSECKI
jgi:hypothetical protein